MAEVKKLYRSNDSVIGGVCAGFAEFFDIDPIIVRILAVMLLLASFGVVMVGYTILWLILPKRSLINGAIPFDCGFGQPCPQQPLNAQPASQSDAQQSVDAGSGGTSFFVFAGLLLVFIGFTGAFDVFVQGLYWWQVWPLCLMMGALVYAFVPSLYVSPMKRVSTGIVAFAAGLVLLPIATGLLQPKTLICAFDAMWPLLFIVGGLCIIGVALKNDLLLLACALCVAVMCVCVLTLFAIPNPFHAVSVVLPGMPPLDLDINPWL